LLGQPDAVVGAVKDVAGAVHRAGGDAQHQGLAAAPPDDSRGLRVGREMDVVSVHAAEALGADRRQAARHRAMEEELGRLERRQLEIHRDRMTLAGPDHQPILADGEPALAAAGDESAARTRRV
jgi:hypothetical protein